MQDRSLLVKTPFVTQYDSGFTANLGNTPSQAIGDFNRDGKLDIIIAYGTEVGTLGTFLNNSTLGNPNFISSGRTQTAGQARFGTPVVAIDAADFNDDGKLDIVALSGGSTFSVPQMQILAGNGDGSFATGQLITIPQAGFGTYVRALDLNGDRKPDIVVSEPATSTFAVFLNTTPLSSPASFGSAISFTTGQGAYGIDAADFNQDGQIDLVVAELPGAANVFLNTAPTSATTVSYVVAPKFLTDTGTAATIAVDINGDGKLDLVSANGLQIDSSSPPANDVSILLNQATSPGAPAFEVASEFAVDQQPLALVSADLNGDGKPDILTANRGSGDISILINQTQTNSTEPIMSVSNLTVGSQPVSITVGDFNQDGKPDLAVALAGSQQLAVLLNQTPTGSATPVFSAPLLVASGSKARRLCGFWPAIGRPGGSTG